MNQVQMSTYHFLNIVKYIAILLVVFLQAMNFRMVKAYLEG